jgi:hypothetical protein
MTDMEQVLQRSWPLLEIIDRLLYQDCPWYLSDDSFTLQRCPCGCGATVIAVEPRLPELHWPVTKSGVQILNEAKNQTVGMLCPYQDALQHDPRGKLPL